MKTLRNAVLVAAFALASPVALAEVKTVTLSVPGMFCETCRSPSRRRFRVYPVSPKSTQAWRRSKPS